MIFLIPPVQILCLTHLGGGGGWHWLTIFGTWVYHHETMCLYIHDPDTTLNFDLNIKFIGFLTSFGVQPITTFWFDIGLLCLAHGCITIRQRVTNILDPDRTLNFDLKVKLILCLTCLLVWPITFFFIWHWLTIFGTWVYHYEKMWYVHLCSWFDFDLKVKFIGFCHVLMSDL